MNSQRSTAPRPTSAVAPLPPLGAVVCDIDGTLTTTSSALTITKALGVPVGEHARLYRAFKAGTLTGDELPRALCTLWNGARRQDLEAAFATVPLRDTEHLIAAVQEHNVPLALISSSVTEYAQVTAARIGAQYAYGAGRVIYDHHGLLTDIALEANDTTALTALKVTQFHTLARALHLEPDQILVLGNGPNDTGLFNATRRSVIIDPLGNNPHRHHAAYTAPDLLHATTHLADAHLRGATGASPQG
ncbi:haloacid dehalogenase-like hydrolase [Streptomyces sp. NPDC102282]|uniref:haloacid dehalogenase-like hydrolase n=1 Tax=Streptomyces sp. NPDC102282 TaxID=3366154 RepID=UPI003801EB69